MNNTAIANSHFPCHSCKFQYFVLLIFSQIPVTTSLHDPLAASNTGSSKSMNLYFLMSNSKSFSVCFSPLKIIGVKHRLLYLFVHMLLTEQILAQSEPPCWSMRIAESNIIDGVPILLPRAMRNIICFMLSHLYSLCGRISIKKCGRVTNDEPIICITLPNYLILNAKKTRYSQYGSSYWFCLFSLHSTLIYRKQHWISILSWTNP